MKSYHFLIFCAFSLFLSACDEDFFEQTVQIDVPEHTPQLAITSQLVAGDSSLWAYVTHSQGILENGQADLIDNATVEIFKDGLLLETLPFFERGLYLTELGEAFSADPAEYMLKISTDGYDPVEATQQMPTPVPIISASYDPEGALDLEGERVDEISIEFEDPAGEENFYRASVLIQNENWTQEVYLHQLDPIAEQYDQDQYIKDNTFEGKKFTWRVGFYPWFVSPGSEMKIYVRLFSVSRDQYFYERSIYLAQEADDNPFAEPVIIYSNTEGGQGVFSLSAKSEVVIEP
ncbi:MAG: DUF4249 domain-containing protein [Bacteroidota bacterium]